MVGLEKDRGASSVHHDLWASVLFGVQSAAYFCPAMDGLVGLELGRA